VKSLPDLSTMSEIITRTPYTPDAPFASARLKKLKFYGYQTVEFTFGAFPVLRNLALNSTRTILRGDSFPRLETLHLFNGSGGLTGDFPALRSLSLIRGHQEELSFSAPCLQELIFVHFKDANRVIVDRARFPELQYVTVYSLKPSGPLSSSRAIIKSSYDVNQFIPAFQADLPSIGRRPEITLKLDVPEKSAVVARLTAALPTWKILGVSVDREEMESFSLTP